MADDQALIEITADIVAAHVSNNTVSLSDVPALVRTVHAALAQLGASPVKAEPERKAPMVSARAAVKPDSITCMVCGAKKKMLKGHLKSAHGLTPDEYRKEFGLPGDYPIVAPNYSAQRRDLAKSIGLGRKNAAPDPQTVVPENVAPHRSRGTSSAEPIKAAPKPTRRKLTIAG
jgi:predicted transcriptional regulator